MGDKPPLREFFIQLETHHDGTMSAGVRRGKGTGVWGLPRATHAEALRDCYDCLARFITERCEELRARETAAREARETLERSLAALRVIVGEDGE